MNDYTFKLENNWSICIHKNYNKWKINDYHKLFEFKYLEEFLYFINNYDKLGGLKYLHLIIMKNNIKPIWEDKENKNGGYFSLKIDIDNLEETWNTICMYCIGKQLLIHLI